MLETMQFIENHFYTIVLGTLLAIFVLSRLPWLEDKVYALLGFAIFAGFLLYMVFTVPFVDLTIVIIAVLIMTAVDFIQTLREENLDARDKDPGPDRAT